MNLTEEPSEIRDEMANTRKEIEQTLHEIEERVSPSGLTRVAKTSFRQARKLVENEAGQQLAQATSYVERASLSVSDLVRAHPLTAAALGLLAGAVLTYRRKPNQTKLIKENTR